MKITASHSLKLPVPGVEYGSMGASVAIEGEPPESVRSDRDQLARYIQALLSEAKKRTEEHLAQEGARAPNGQESRQTGQSRRPHRPMRSPNGRNCNSHKGRSEASQKQILFIRSLSRDAGLSEDDLAYLAEDLVGARDLRSLSKRDASRIIESLQQNGR